MKKIVLLAGLAVGAVVGWTSTPVLYHSQGLLDVEPSDRENGASIRDEFWAARRYAKTQVVFMRDQRVLLRAMESEKWRSLGRPSTEHALEEFRRKLSVRHDDQTVGETCGEAFEAHVGAAQPAGLGVVEAPAMHGVHHRRDAGEPGGQPTDHAGLGGVRVHEIHTLRTHVRTQSQQTDEIPPGLDRVPQVGDQIDGRVRDGQGLGVQHAAPAGNQTHAKLRTIVVARAEQRVLLGPA